MLPSGEQQGQKESGGLRRGISTKGSTFQGEGREVEGTEERTQETHHTDKKKIRGQRREEEEERKIEWGGKKPQQSRSSAVKGEDKSPGERRRERPAVWGEK